MAWQQLQIKSTADNVDLISDVLMGLGSEAVTLLDAQNQPLLEPGPGETPFWDEAWVSALFPENENIDDILQQLTLILSNKNLVYRLIPLEDKNWTRQWLEHFKPMHFGEKLWVTPKEHLHEITDENAVVVVLDPGLAFGTGTHPTTALCLTWLEAHIAPHQSVIDYGCGSGILAIAAAKLGAAKVFCIDNDPQALIATRDNAKRNGLTHQQIITQSPEEFKPFTADILLANILAIPLIKLAPKFFSLAKNNGLIALSGILTEQAKTIQAVYGSCFELDLPQIQDQWTLVWGTKR